jgi:hypothetical protein
MNELTRLSFALLLELLRFMSGGERRSKVEAKEFKAQRRSGNAALRGQRSGSASASATNLSGEKRLVAEMKTGYLFHLATTRGIW